MSLLKKILLDLVRATKIKIKFFTSYITRLNIKLRIKLRNDKIFWSATLFLFTAHVWTAGGALFKSIDMLLQNSVTVMILELWLPGVDCWYFLIPWAVAFLITGWWFMEVFYMVTLFSSHGGEYRRFNILMVLCCSFVNLYCYYFWFFYKNLTSLKKFLKCVQNYIYTFEDACDQMVHSCRHDRYIIISRVGAQYTYYTLDRFKQRPKWAPPGYRSRTKHIFFFRNHICYALRQTSRIHISHGCKFIFTKQYNRARRK